MSVAGAILPFKGDVDELSGMATIAKKSSTVSAPGIGHGVFWSFHIAPSAAMLLTPVVNTR